MKVIMNLLVVVNLSTRQLPNDILISIYIYLYLYLWPIYIYIYGLRNRFVLKSIWTQQQSSFTT